MQDLRFSFQIKDSLPRHTFLKENSVEFCVGIRVLFAWFYLFHKAFKEYHISGILGNRFIHLTQVEYFIHFRVLHFK